MTRVRVLVQCWQCKLCSVACEHSSHRCLCSSYSQVALPLAELTKERVSSGSREHQALDTLKDALTKWMSLPPIPHASTSYTRTPRASSSPEC